MIAYLSVAQLLHLHARQLDTFGGTPGLRDRGLLEAAAARPQATFDGEDLYPDVAAKTAALMHSLVQDHAFVDGNKRVGAMAAEFFLAVNDVSLEVSDEDWVDFTLRVARGEACWESIAIWLRQRLSPRAP